jgi:NAD(P) transhydrogenase subunit alpha
MEAQLDILTVVVFVLAALVGHHVVHRVPPLLHTPLMSATNAISAISVVGALAVAGTPAGPELHTLKIVLGTIAVAAAMTNVVGGFLITDRMLKMFKSGGAQAKGLRR